MPTRLPDEVMPTLFLTQEEELAVEREASTVVTDTAAAFEDFVAGGRTFSKHHWKLVKEKASFRVYRSRQSYAALMAATSSSISSIPSISKPQMSFSSSSSNASTFSKKLTSSSSESSSSSSGARVANVAPASGTAEMHKFPVIVLTGIIPGTMEDAGLGSIADTEALWRLRSSYVDDAHRDCKILATIKRPSRDKPFRYLGIKWAWRRVPALVQQRDMVYAERTGVVRDAQGRLVLGYNAMHSVDLPGIPELSQYDILRMKVSLCFLSRPHDDKSIEIYCRAFCVPVGEMPESLSMSLYADALLASANVMDCAHLKKLMWLTQQRHRRRLSRQPSAESERSGRTFSIGGEDDGVELDHCQGCQRSLKRFGGLSRSTVVMCRCCRRSVCSKCITERNIVVDVAPDGSLTERLLSFCIGCILESRTLPAMDIAREDVDKRVSTPSIG